MNRADVFQTVALGLATIVGCQSSQFGESTPLPDEISFDHWAAFGGFLIEMSVLPTRDMPLMNEGETVGQFVDKLMDLVNEPAPCGVPQQ